MIVIVSHFTFGLITTKTFCAPAKRHAKRIMKQILHYTFRQTFFFLVSLRDFWCFIIVLCKCFRFSSVGLLQRYGNMEKKILAVLSTLKFVLHKFLLLVWDPFTCLCLRGLSLNSFVLRKKFQIDDSVKTWNTSEKLFLYALQHPSVFLTLWIFMQKFRLR